MIFEMRKHMLYYIHIIIDIWVDVNRYVMSTRIMSTNIKST